MRKGDTAYIGRRDPDSSTERWEAFLCGPVDEQAACTVCQQKYTDVQVMPSLPEAQELAIKLRGSS